MIRFGMFLYAVLGLGLASVPAPALAQRAGTGASDQQLDFQCFVLLRQRRAAFVANEQMSTAQKAGLVNNLTIISAYYAGRISQYPLSDMYPRIASATAEANAATLQQRDSFAATCADNYLNVMAALSTASE